MRWFRDLIQHHEGRLIAGIALLALAIQVGFACVIFPRLSGSLDLAQNADLFGQLARN